MAKAKKRARPDVSTEEKIKKAAWKLFMKKGYAATRTRDISEEAGINLALLNYYFRSKEKLFEILMTEILQNFFRGISAIINDEKTSVSEKVEIFVAQYTDLLRQQPDLPLFIFHEIRLNPKKLAVKMGVKELFFNSFFFHQLREKMDGKKGPRVNPLHLIINMISMCVFPFIGAPLLKHLAPMDAAQFDRFIQERKKLVPQWMELMMRRE